jgi:glutamate--cysteine ligase
MRLSEPAAGAWIPRTCFKHGPPGRVGVELELVVRPVREPERATDGPEYDEWRAAALALPAYATITIEPGGQLELSSPPADDLVSCLRATAADLHGLRRLAADHGVELVGIGMDQREVRRLVRREPRYAAMQSYLDRWGPAGRTMMRRTASVQVNLEAADARAGDDPTEAIERRWDLLSAIGPTLVAAFANSPGRAGRWHGWASTRMAVWLTIDPGRTAEPRARPGETIPQAWARWCLDAPLMLARRPGGDWSAPPGVTFRDWIDCGTFAVPGRDGPTVDDLAYHLTTLFPPVRARGHLEVRYLDAQPGDWWQVPVSVLWALCSDAAAAHEAIEVCADQRGRWRDAARCGMGDPALARAATRVLGLARDALCASAHAHAAAPAVDAYLDHWTSRGRSPGDDLRSGRPVPPAPTTVHSGFNEHSGLEDLTC